MQTRGAGHGSDGALSFWLCFVLPVGKKENFAGIGGSAPVRNFTSLPVM